MEKITILKNENLKNEIDNFINIEKIKGLEKNEKTQLKNILFGSIFFDEKNNEIKTALISAEKVQEYKNILSQYFNYINVSEMSNNQFKNILLYSLVSNLNLQKVKFISIEDFKSYYYKQDLKSSKNIFLTFIKKYIEVNGLTVCLFNDKITLIDKNQLLEIEKQNNFMKWEQIKKALEI